MYCIGSSTIDVNKIIHAIYTIARDYRNANLADENTLPKSDKLVWRVSEIGRIISGMLKLREEDHDALKSIEQQLFSGFLLLLQSCQTKSLSNYLLGSLKISSSLTSITGIQGSPDILILEATGYIFQIFGTVLEEENLTKNGFEGFQSNDTETEFTEAKEHFLNLLHPIVINSGLKEVRLVFKVQQDEERYCNYTEEDALQILRMHQKPLKVYTKLEGLILTYCTDEHISNMHDRVFYRCLTAVKQYSEISRTHQSLLLRSLSILQHSNITEKRFFINTLLHHVESLFKKDYVTLGFLFNPMKSYHATKVIYMLHLQQITYKNVLDHMIVLNTKYILYSRNGVVLCRQVELKGLCREIRPTIESNFMGKYWKFQPLKDWKEARSMFIPPRFQVEFMSSDIDVARNRPHSYHGPFKGLAVYSNRDAFDLRNIRISVEAEYQIDPQTRICTDNGWCDTFSDDTKSFKSVHGIDISQSLLTSIEIPDGMFVKMFTADGSVIPLVGPFSTTDLEKCKVWSWSNIVQIKKFIIPNNSAVTRDVLFEVFSQREENLGVDDDVLKGSEIHVSTKLKRFSESEVAKEERSDMMVVLCTKPYLKGFCVQYSTDYAISGLFSTFQRLFHTECKLGMQSILIPGGVKVIGFQKIGEKFSAFGPYIGPNVLGKLDHNGEYMIEVLNLFKETKVSGSVEKAKARTINPKIKGGKKILRNVNSVYDFF